MCSFLGNLVKIPNDWQYRWTCIGKVCQTQFIRCSSHFEDRPGGRLRSLLPTKRNAYTSNTTANRSIGRRIAMMNEEIRVTRQDSTEVLLSKSVVSWKYIQRLCRWLVDSGTMHIIPHYLPLKHTPHCFGPTGIGLGSNSGGMAGVETRASSSPILLPKPSLVEGYKFRPSVQLPRCWPPPGPHSTTYRRSNESSPTIFKSCPEIIPPFAAFGPLTPKMQPLSASPDGPASPTKVSGLRQSPFACHHCKRQVCTAAGQCGNC